MRDIQFATYRLPYHWASALINDDLTGLNDAEERDMNEALENIVRAHGPMAFAVDVGEPQFGQADSICSNALAGEVADYTFHVDRGDTYAEWRLARECSIEKRNGVWVYVNNEGDFAPVDDPETALFHLFD